jgi:hypothetical protein
MLSQATNLSLKATGAAGNIGNTVNQSDSVIPSPKLNVNSSVRERTVYGLSKETLSMLVTGASFTVHNFLGLKSTKFFFVTTDIASLGSRSETGKHQKLTPFTKFES